MGDSWANWGEPRVLNVRNKGEQGANSSKRRENRGEQGAKTLEIKGDSWAKKYKSALHRKALHCKALHLVCNPFSLMLLH
ncbi:hypothetical protein EGLA_14920 [Enterococcus gallinarum]|nr:hypothetical protein AH4_32370 [Enterococcus gallinarum]